jgi:nitrite reductase/ring-hydroxylating ferredoxin subunit
MIPNGPGDPALVLLERPPGRTQWTFSYSGRSFAVFEVGGELVVTDAACPHNGGPLAQGELNPQTCQVTCPWHAWRWDVQTGRAVAPPVNERLLSYRVKVEGDDVLVELA